MSDPENINSNTHLLNENYKKTTKKKLKDPLLVQTVSLHEDIYALTWNCPRIKSWENKKIHDQEIFLTGWDKTKLVLHFIFFIIVVIATVGILLYESFVKDAYNDAPWPIIILRITLVAFAQRKLEPEIYQGLALYRYTLKFSNEFYFPFFAKFVSICQFFIATLTFIAIFLFVCMADSALQLIMNFAGLAVISELDDWVGEQIMSESVFTEFEEEGKYSKDNMLLDNINSRMTLYSKMCLVGEEMEIDDDQNKQVSILSWLANKLPWVFLPLLTLPCEWILLKAQGIARISSELKQ